MQPDELNAARDRFSCTVLRASTLEDQTRRTIVRPTRS
jgi:hypothetical protein